MALIDLHYISQYRETEIAVLKSTSIEIAVQRESEMLSLSEKLAV